MSSFRLTLSALAAVLAIGCFGTTAPAADKAEPATIDVEVVKFDGLEKAIAKHKGKVVVVDFWATWCLPCMEAFPELVQLHKDLGGKGVVCVSVSIDDPDNKARAVRFLKKQEATFPNLLLNEKPEDIEGKLGFASIPTVMVYGKDGKRLKTFNARSPETVFTYKDVRKVVDPLVGGDEK